MRIETRALLQDLSPRADDSASSLPPPRLGPTLQGVADAQKADATEPTLQLPAPNERPNLREMSPRELAGLAHDFYLEGLLSWDEYRLVGFPSELHPDFDATIGSLTGERAEPDKPRDMISAWQYRLDFERTHNTNDPTRIARTERILNVLRWQETPGVKVDV